MTAVGVSFVEGTTAQLFATVSQGTTLKIYTEQSNITDLPSTNGVLEIIKGPSNENQRYAILHGSDGTVWHYKYHAGNTAQNGWNRIIQNADIQSGSVSITPTAINTSTYKSITFPVPFSVTPAVTATPVTSGPNVVSTSVLDITPAGCKIYLTRSDTAQATSVMWIAAK